MNLTASTLNAALKGTSALKAGRHSDGRNLYLSVSDTGSMSWVFMWGSGKTRREMGLGSFTGAGAAFRLSLNEARLKADEVRALLAKGVDPLADKKRATTTFEQMLLAEIEANKSNWKGDGNEVQWLRSMELHAAKLLPMSVAKVSEADVLAVLRPIWKTIPVTADRVRFRIEKTLDRAHKLRDGENPARLKLVERELGELPSKKVRMAQGEQVNHRALAHAELPAFMARLLKATGNGAKALALCILTATRTDETRLMQWSEVDLDAGLWVIPAVRMKAGIEHHVPLSTQAVELLRSVPRVEGTDYVFTGTKGDALGETALADKLTKKSAKGGLGYAGKATVHGFRSTFSDWVGDETTFAPEDREFCLAHGLDAVEGAYRRSTAVAKRRAIMQAWANFAHGVQANVTHLRAAA